MKNVFKPFHGLLLFLMISSFMFAGCGPYSFMGKGRGGGKNPQPLVDGALNSSDMQKVVTYRVIGKGIEPERSRSRVEAQLMAERAAVADGYRLLVEKIHGVYLDSQAFVRNGSVDYTLLRTETQAWLRGAEVVEINRLSNGITEAVMTVKLNFFRKDNRWHPGSFFGISSSPTTGQLSTPPSYMSDAGN
ncbi:conserved hypothetical protein [Desulforapulum autotrophicum HRM2]|uniref:Lipoprotein n=2 Tax=Desulforapulum autotrophicum TaxID=2296 RepID=C0QG48_DESAH|nr:conserved hypothetical protein [Desulforapulum autotrophicum HRM2]